MKTTPPSQPSSSPLTTKQIQSPELAPSITPTTIPTKNPITTQNSEESPSTSEPTTPTPTTSKPPSNPTPKKNKLNKNVLNLIRTTQRNNIDLKNIADNKANILMSINALMITFLIPIVFANIGVIMDRYLYLPLALLTGTCIITLTISAIVLRPFSSNNRFKPSALNVKTISPFFFENSGEYTEDEFHDYLIQVSENDEKVLKYAVSDLYYFSNVLAIKYKQIRWAYMVFIFGLFASLVVLVILLGIIDIPLR